VDAGAELEQRFVSALLDTAGALIVVLDRDGRIVRFNRTCEQITGYRSGEVKGRLVSDLFLASEEREPFKAVLRALQAGGPPSQFEYHWLTSSGGRRLIAWSHSTLRGPEGEVQWILGVGIDLTERKRAEESSRESRAQLASVIASAMDAIITIDADQRIILFNAAAEQMFGYPASEAVGQPLDRFIPERYRTAHREHIPAFGRTHISKRRMGALGSVSGLRANGEEFQLEASISQLEATGEKLYTVILRDITERKRVEERLREQAALLDHAQDAILVRNLSDQILFWNKGAERLYGWTAEEAQGKDVRDLIFRTSLPQFNQAKQTLLERGEWVGELRQTTKDGKEIIVESRWTLVRDDAGEPRSILVINTDITAKKKLEAQFLRAQRMESIGTLAGGIAHDLNNVLSPVLTAVQLLQLKFSDPESQRLLQILQTNIERGGDMVKQVLTFARGIEGERIVLQPRHLIKEAVKILKETLPRSIAIRSSIKDDLWSVTGDATQLYQVLMNLCVNARDAMPDGGLLTIEAENITLDDNYARMHLEANPGQFVVIKVTDTGVGIPAQHIDKIFEPFFTTKEYGKGTGLGLSTAAGIVKSHGGFVDAYSEVGRGTQFKVYLPATTLTGSKLALEPLRELPVGHGEWVLVVDDEAAILEITRETLEAYGYKVLTASDGTEALALYAERKDEIRIVLTDMMMPYMDGPATIRALQRLNPQVRIIASSGLAADSKIAEAASAGVEKFLPKPYTAEKLLKALAEVLTAE
jgi:PAS domain S-box-containing protein